MKIIDADKLESKLGEIIDYYYKTKEDPHNTAIHAIGIISSLKAVISDCSIEIQEKKE